MAHYLNVYRNRESGNTTADILDDYHDAIEELAHADTAAWEYIETFYRNNRGAGIINLLEAADELSASRGDELTHERQERWAGVA